VNGGRGRREGELKHLVGGVEAISEADSSGQERPITKEATRQRGN